MVGAMLSCLVASAHANEETPESTQTESQVDQLIRILLEGPQSGETDFQSYVMIGVALVLLLIAYKVYNGKGEEEVEQLTFEDEIKSGKIRDSIDEEAARADFLKKIDQANVVHYDSSGVLLAESLAELRKLISTHAMTVFKDRKEELMTERLEFMKNDDWVNYQGKIGQAAKEYTAVMQTETKAVLQHLNIQDQTFMQSIQTHMQNPKTRGLLEQAELKARQEFDSTECTLSKTELKAVFLELTRMEQEASYKLL